MPADCVAEKGELGRFSTSSENNSYCQFQGYWSLSTSSQTRTKDSRADYLHKVGQRNVTYHGTTALVTYLRDSIA